MKRAFDFILAFLALLVAAPVLATAALLVYLRMGSPVLFRQSRAGWHGELFTIFKLRTMQGGEITPLGRFLRRTALDELPQLWNILRGDMSVVGPRPLLAEYLPRYTDQQLRRH